MQSLIRGGQITIHKITMFKQVVAKCTHLSLLAALLVTFIILSQQKLLFKPSDNATYIQAYIVSNTEDRLTSIYKFNFFNNNQDSKPLYSNPPSPKTITIKTPQGSKEISAKAILKTSYYKRSFNALLHLIQKAVLVFVASSISIIGLAALILSKLGRLGTKQQITEGIGIQTASQINKILKKTAGQSFIKVGGMHLVKDSQTKHILALGSTGSGKTNLFHTILPQVRNQNQAAFVLDHTGELIDRYFQEGDIIFNPLDPKSHAWDFGQELASSGRLDLFARSLFCYKKTTDEIWGNSSRQLFIDSFNLIKNQGGSLKDLYTFLTQSSLSDMSKKLTNTASKHLIDPKNDRTSMSILANTTASIGWLNELEHDQSNNDQKFSIQTAFEDITTNNKNTWIFIHQPKETRGLFQELNSCLLTLAITSLMQMGVNPARRFWFIIDEIAAFRNLRELSTSAAELRKYGGCILGATQNINQLYEIYGVAASKVILDQFRTKFFFAGTVDHDLLSSCFGSVEVQKQQESISYGAHEMRDGVSISDVTKSKLLVTAADIAGLKPLECYVTLPHHEARFAKLQIPFVPKK